MVQSSIALYMQKYYFALLNFINCNLLYWFLDHFSNQWVGNNVLEMQPLYLFPIIPSNSEYSQLGFLLSSDSIQNMSTIVNQ